MIARNEGTNSLYWKKMKIYVSDMVKILGQQGLIFYTKNSFNYRHSLRYLHNNLTIFSPPFEVSLFISCFPDKDRELDIKSGKMVFWGFSCDVYTVNMI